LTELAHLQFDRADFITAHERANEALGLMESIRLSVESPSLRASFFTTARDIEELDIEALMRLHAQQPLGGFDAAALLTAERGRGRSLLEMLSESGTEIRRGVDPELLAREHDLERLISAKAERQTRLMARKHTEAEAAAAAEELDTLATELEQVQSSIRERSPRYSSLTHPSPLNLRQIQTTVLDEDTVLLEYCLGVRKSFVWVVTPSSIEVSELPRRSDIESAARGLYESLTARNGKPGNEAASQWAVRVRESDKAWFAAAAKLSSVLLGPATLTIRNKRLLILGESVLQYLAFAALPEPAAGNTAESVPLIVNHEVVTAPSASVMAIVRHEIAGRKRANKAVAILGDPVFSADDPRISQQKRVAAGARDTVSLDASESGAALRGREFVRLRFSRIEAEEIARLAPAKGTLKALDFDASRETVLTADLGQYRIVHFATHSLLDNQRADLSGVVLSLVDRSGRRQNGFLRLYDIYNLRLESDLVVLSACQTALGDDIKGEGLIGLTRGFLYAGAPRVVATFWNVDDRTTAEAMKRFYEGMLARGERPAAALRATQISMWKTKGWDAPYYWAAFTFQGEWR